MLITSLSIINVLWAGKTLEVVSAFFDVFCTEGSFGGKEHISEACFDEDDNDLVFYFLFNIILVISRRCRMIMKGSVQ